MNADPEVMRYFPAVQTLEQSNASIDAWLVHFEEHGYSNWAAERNDTGEFIGFVGLSIPKRQLPFSPCVEIGWRLKRSAWGQGFASEGARECLRFGFEALGLNELVSFTSLLNRPSIAVMERIGMRNAREDFEHPGVPAGSPLRPHCLYRVLKQEWQRGAA